MRAWDAYCSPEPYDFLASPAPSSTYKSKCGYDIAAAVQRQRNFNYQVSFVEQRELDPHLGPAHTSRRERLLACANHTYRSMQSEPRQKSMHMNCLVDQSLPSLQSGSLSRPLTAKNARSAAQKAVCRRRRSKSGAENALQCSAAVPSRRRESADVPRTLARDCTLYLIMR